MMLPIATIVAALTSACICYLTLQGMREDAKMGDDGGFWPMFFALCFCVNLGVAVGTWAKLLMGA